LNKSDKILGVFSPDAENRMTEVKKNGVTMAQFTYNGDGQRVKSVMNGETTLFVGGYFEKKGSEITKYYPGGAIRKYTIPQSMSVEYVLGDHLGSANVMTDSTGGKVSEMRYSPWGQVRYYWVNSNLSTTPAYMLPMKTFTGQFSYMDDPSTQSATEGFGLMFYQSRFYDPVIGRFSQADTIVPGGVQGLDRYAYTANNPVRYVDPSGHQNRPSNCEWDHSDYCSRILPTQIWQNRQDEQKKMQDTMSRCASGQASPEECVAIIQEVMKKFNLHIPYIPKDSEFSEYFKKIVIIYDPDYEGSGDTIEEPENGQIELIFGPPAFRSTGWLGSSIDHEICHVNQIFGFNCAGRKGGYGGTTHYYTTPRKFSFVTQGGALNEVEAYDFELSLVDYFGLTDAEVLKLEERRNYYLSALNKTILQLALQHNYVCSDYTCEWAAHYTY
jgi:RHS repeat-associated protein